MGNGFEITYSAQPRGARFRDWESTGPYLHITRLRTRYMKDSGGQTCSAGKFISHQNPTVLEKRGMLAVSKQLSNIDENVSAWQINYILDSLFSFFP